MASEPIAITLPDDLFFTPPVIARQLKFSRAKAYELVKKGKIRCSYVDGQPHMARADLKTDIPDYF